MKTSTVQQADLPTDTRPHRVPATLIAVVLLLLLSLVTACARIPTSGPVGTYSPDEQSKGEDSYNFDVPGPTSGDAPETIVRGFLAAGVSSNGDWTVARSFLTAEQAPEWDPTARVLVTDSVPAVTQRAGENGKLSARPRVIRTINSNGVRSEAQNANSKKLSFQLTRENGEWRISKAPDGVVVDSASFSEAFSPVTLYFYNPQHTAMVPDVRWFARRQGRGTAVVTALLKGPAPYLRDSVVSAFPADAELARPTVPLQDETAVVDVPESVVAGASDRDRSLMMRQLTKSLTSVNDIEKVTLSVDQQPLRVPAEAERNPPVVNPKVPSKLVGLSKDGLVRVTDSGSRPIKADSSLGDDLADPTVQAGGSDRYAVLTHNRSRLMVVDGSNGKVHELASGPKMTAPTYDEFGWVWTSDDHGVVAYHAEKGTERRIDAHQAKSGTVTSLRVAPDGARLALTVNDRRGDHAFVAGIKRKKNDAPTGIGRPLEIGTGAQPTRAEWVSDTKLAVFRPDPTSRVDVDEVSITGTREKWGQPLLGLTDLTVASGPDQVYAQNADGLYKRTRSGWRHVNLGGSDVSYPG